MLRAQLSTHFTYFVGQLSMSGCCDALVGALKHHLSPWEVKTGDLIFLLKGSFRIWASVFWLFLRKEEVPRSPEAQFWEVWSMGTSRPHMVIKRGNFQVWQGDLFCAIKNLFTG